MRRIIVAFFVGFIFSPNVVLSEDTIQSVRMKFDTRFDFTSKVPTHDSLSTLSSFDGKYLNIILEGDINESFSYKYRQRMILDSKPGYQSFFNATDWLYLKYRVNNNFSILGGKQVVAIGGFEYDAAPIDLYLWSTFWNNVICYQIGGMVNYNTTDNKHTIGFQITNSPFTTETLQDIYCYNLIWYGNFNQFSTIYSLNRIEFEKDNYINYIALGNKISTNKLSVEFDMMNRFSDSQNDLLSDYSIIGSMKYQVNNKLTVFTKAGYDENTSQKATSAFIYDRFVTPGTEYFFCGAGVEYFPITNSKDVRIHAVWSTNNNSIQYNTFSIGLRWQMNVLKK